MKYNLKSRHDPWKYNYANIEEALKSRDEQEKWFEGFEKELRDMINDLTPSDEQPSNWRFVSQGNFR